MPHASVVNVLHHCHGILDDLGKGQMFVQSASVFSDLSIMVCTAECF